MKTFSMTPRERMLIYPGIFACLGSLLVFLFFNYRHYINSDSASVILLADEVIRSGQWIPASWYYVSDQVPILANNHLAIPFVALLGPTVLAHAFTSACGALLCLMCLYQLGRATALDQEWSLLGAVLVMTGTSLIYVDLLLGQMTSVELAKLSLFLTVLLRLLQGKHVRLSLAIACALLLIQFAASPRKAFAFFLFPALAASVLQVVLPWDRPALLRHHRLALFAMLAAALMGVLAHGWLTTQLSINTSYASFVPASGSGRISQNLHVLWQLTLKFLDLTGDGPALPLLLHFMSNFLRAICALGFAAGVGIAIWHAQRGRDRTLIFLAAFTTASAVLILVALVLGSGIKSYYGIYYLGYAAAPATFLAIHALRRSRVRWRLLAIVFGVMPALLLSLKIYLFADPKHGVHYRGPSIKQTTDNDDKRQLIRWVDAQGFDHGYALFWDANAMTVLSDGRIRVVPLRKRMDPFKWLTSTSSIAEAQRSVRTFIAIPEVTTDAPLPAVCRASSTHELGAYRVYVLDRIRPGCPVQNSDWKESPNSDGAAARK